MARGKVISKGTRNGISCLAVAALLSLAAAAHAQLSNPLTTLDGAAAPGREPRENQAKTKLKQARAALAQGEFDAAEGLAREAGVLFRFGDRGETPTRVLDDVAHARKDPKTLLAASRTALKNQEFDRAEKLATAAEANASKLSFPLWSDSPSKVKKDIQAARAKETSSAKLPPVKLDALDKPEQVKPSSGFFSPVTSLFGTKKPKKASKKEAAMAKADWMKETAKPIPADKLSQDEKQTDLTDAPKESEKPASDTASSMRKTANAHADTEQARRLIVDGRKALAKGQLDKAASLAEQARALRPDLAWHEDNPERLLRSVNDLRAHSPGVKPGVSATPVVRKNERPAPVVKEEAGTLETAPARSQQEAALLLKEGRREMDAGKFEEVHVTLTRVRSFKEGKYGLFDDSPDKLQNDLAKARARKERAESVQVLAKARKQYEAGEYDAAMKLAFQAQQMHGAYNIWDLGDRPSKLIDEVQAAKEKKNNATVIASRKTKGDKTAASKPLPDGPEKQQARQLLAEARTLQSKGKLAEAKQKVDEAEALPASFTAAELSPGLLRQQLAARARQKSDILAQKAVDLAAYGEGAPTENYKAAEKMLQDAREIAVTFSLETKGIEEKSKYVASLKARPAAGGIQVAGGAVVTPGIAPIMPPQGVVGDPNIDQEARKQGLRLLENSRGELRRGNTSVARRMAEQAFEGQYGVKPLAEQRLKEIDIEEFNQKRREQDRNFDAALAYFNRGDFAKARVILAGVEVQHLNDQRQNRYRELMASREMANTEVLAKVTLPDQPPPGQRKVTDRGEGPKVGESGPTISGDPTAGKISIAEGDLSNDLMISTKAMREIKFQELRANAMAAMRKATDFNAQGDSEGAISMLQDFIAKLPEEKLDGDRMSMLRKPIDNKIRQYQLMAEQSNIDRQVAGAKRSPQQQINNIVLAQQNKQKNVAQLMKQFTEYYKQGKYKEAENYARMVVELDPDNPVATAAVTLSRTQYRMSVDKARKAQNEETFWKADQDAGGIGPFADVTEPLVVEKDGRRRGRNRTDLSRRDVGPPKPRTVREIEAKLDLPVTVNYSEVPLRDVINSLGDTQSINIIPDTAALNQENISLNRPVTVKLDHVSLKSALNIILRSVDLTWVIRDEALQVTTAAHAKGKLVQRTILVADLVIPIEDHKTPEVFDWAKQVQRLNNIQAPERNNGTHTPTPSQGPLSLQGGSSVGSATGSPFATGSQNGQFATNQQPVQQMTRSGPANAMPQQLINLITNTVAPDSWSTVSGPGTIEYFPLGMTLVINQTPDIQEQIAELLQQLRRLQDLEVAIEVRLISLSENFFERMGVNFNVNVKTDRETRPYEPTLVQGLATGQFKPLGFVQDFSPSKFIAGITPANTFTSDLDIPLRTSSFGLATPPFGLGVPFTGNTTGGMSFGLAFLSDIQVYFFLEAAQGDQRFNVMQSPKIMAFNGQSVSLNAGYSQIFVTGVQVALQGSVGGPLFVPNASVQNYGTALNIQPVVTGDRRFVRVNVDLNLTNPVAEVPVFPIVVTVQPFIEGVGSVGNPSILTQFIQQPAANFINVQTTAVVPDGGTVLLGGLKRLAEGRNEFGPPILSKIPYLNRLVKNVGYGRETENILMMITPRIVINEEEEIIQTGVISNPALNQGQ